MSASGVYFIAEADERREYVKIGRSNRLESRMESLRTSSPRPLELVFFWSLDDITNIRRLDGRTRMANIVSAERMMHEHWSAHRVRGEWFSLTGDLAGFIDNPYPLLEGRYCDLCGLRRRLTYAPDPSAGIKMACRGHPVCFGCDEEVDAVYWVQGHAGGCLRCWAARLGGLHHAESLAEMASDSGRVSVQTGLTMDAT